VIILVALQIAAAAADNPEDQDTATACPLASSAAPSAEVLLLPLSDFISLQPDKAAFDVVAPAPFQK